MWNNLRNSMTKNRFSQHIQKTEHINWGSFGIFHAAERKLLPKFYRRLTLFYWKSQRFASSVPYLM